MFGKSQSGMAQIVARRPHEGLHHLKADTGIYRRIWDYIADVELEDGGEVFRATFTETFEGFDGHQPDVGERVRVTFNPKKRDRVELDRSALRADSAAAEGADGFEALANAAPGTAPPASVPPTAAAPAGHTVDFSATIAAIAAARASGDLEEVKRLKAEFAARRAAEP